MESNSLLRSKANLILLGDSTVGKTSLLNMYFDRKFSNQIPSTAGIDCMRKTLKIDDIEIELQVFDTAGQERFNTLPPSYFK